MRVGHAPAGKRDCRRPAHGAGSAETETGPLRCRLRQPASAPADSERRAPPPPTRQLTVSGRVAGRLPCRRAGAAHRELRERNPGTLLIDVGGLPVDRMGEARARCLHSPILCKPSLSTARCNYYSIMGRCVKNGLIILYQRQYYDSRSEHGIVLQYIP
jgi:hypothetical protein